MMADNSSAIHEYIPNTSQLNKIEDDPVLIPSNSPRYNKKKRIPIGQARKHNSQYLVQCNKLKLSDKSCKEAMFLNMPESTDIFQNESSISTNILDKGNDFCKVIKPNAIHRTLKHCNSLPLMDVKLVNVLKSKSKSCDNLLICSMEGTVSDSKLSYMKTIESEVPVFCAKNDEKLNENTAENDEKLNENTSENISTDFKSRKSSTSTLRERNNSQDSAFSYISVSDIKEIEAAAYINAVDIVSSNWKPQHSRSRSDATSEISKHELSNSEVFSLPSSLSKDAPVKKKSIFEGQQMVVPTECFFPRPQQGQSLTSFLSSNEFNISAELDRENAHFCISDALISAIEHMKCSRTLKMIDEVDDDDESDEEIRILTQRIRIRKRERQREKVLKSIALLSDGKTDTTTSQSASPPLSSHSSDYEVDSLCSEDEVEDLELSAHTDSNLNSMKVNGLSLSMASLYSEADIHKAQMLHQESINKKFQESDSVNLTAESVALSLLRKYSEKHLPKASDLEWLVSEQEAPQRLLPLPDSWPVSPDAIEEEYNLGNTRLRGNFEWAPPRSQIIFIIHPHMKRKEIMEKQKFRCAGCGMKIEKNYISRFRYCEYFGKYFCQCCHSNSLAYIPGHILWKWDFSKYYVSNIARDLLDNMFADPLFNIEDINRNLYQKVRLLDLCRYYRMQLFYLKDFIRTCRKADTIQLVLEKQNHHIIYEPHTFSISDLVQVKKGDLSKHLSQIVNICLDHVKQCILCQAKGFICEICQKDSDIIFPFQFDKVILCQNCGSCFHKRCCKKVKCPRCVRIQERKKRLAECKSDEEL